jgi:hypothetical protein
MMEGEMTETKYQKYRKDQEDAKLSTGEIETKIKHEGKVLEKKEREIKKEEEKIEKWEDQLTEIDKPPKTTEEARLDQLTEYELLAIPRRIMTPEERNELNVLRMKLGPGRKV